jgi:hypothetical protein
MEKIHQKSYRQLNELGDRIVDRIFPSLFVYMLSA